MIDYTVQYKKVKNITLRIGSDGQLKITAPHQTSQRVIESVITEKLQWIANQQQKVRMLQQQRQTQGLENQYCDNGHIAYLGQSYPLQITAEGTRRWHWDGATLRLTGCSQEDYIRQLVEDFYRQQLLTDVLPMLNQQVRQRMAALQPPEPTIQVRKMRASWGLCYSREKRIILNLWLAMAPLDCIRQVLVHEYIHFFQNNHSPEFYALLEQFEPQYRQLKHTLSIMVDLRAQIPSAEQQK